LLLQLHFQAQSRMALAGGGIPIFNIIPFGFAATMASIDSTMLSLIKYISIHKKHVGWLILPMIVYSFQPVLFYLSLHYETLTVMNLLWDVISDVIITTIGLFVFKETIGPFKKAGVILSLMSIVLLSLNDGF
jgi:multidrug transporter EmrE-like cation transporter